MGALGSSGPVTKAKPFKVEDYLLTPDIVRVRNKPGVLVLRRC